MRTESLKCVGELARADRKVVFIGSDLGADVFEDLRRDLPDQFFIEGICEQALIGMAAGLAMEGFVPYVNTIATFLTRRCFEQIAVDLCMHDLPVKLIGYGGGLAYAALGPTHQAIDDIGILRTLPNMTVLAPCDALEARRLIYETLTWPHPAYLRLSRGGDRIISNLGPKECKIGKAVLMREPGDVLIASTGIMSQRALEASRILQTMGIRAGVLHVHTVKPLDEELIGSLASNISLVVTVEEHVCSTGLGAAIALSVRSKADRRIPKVCCLGLPDSFASKYGTQDELLAMYGLDPHGIADFVIASNP